MRMLPLFASSATVLFLLGASGARAQAGAPADEAALRAPPPSQIQQVVPANGADVPTNVRVTFLMEFQDAGGIQGELSLNGQTTALQSQQLACPSGCLGIFELGTLTAGASPELVLGTDLEFTTELTYDVDGAEDTAPPELGGDHVVSSTFDAFDGQHTGYIGQVNVPRATDNYGIAYYEIHSNAEAFSTGDDGLALSAIVFGEPATIQSSFFLHPEVTEACVRVVAVDWAGHSRESETICEDVVPPTDEELADTIQPVGCGFGGPVAQPGLALFGLLGGLRIRRRIRQLKAR